jgi:hypothetical protein
MRDAASYWGQFGAHTPGCSLDVLALLRPASQWRPRRALSRDFGLQQCCRREPATDEAETGSAFWIDVCGCEDVVRPGLCRDLGEGGEEGRQRALVVKPSGFVDNTNVPNVKIQVKTGRRGRKALGPVAS